MDGTHWQISLYVECTDCGEKHFDCGGGRFTEITTSYKFIPTDDDLDELRTDFLMNLELLGWQCHDLDHWDADGKWYCRLCMTKLVSGEEAIAA